VETAIENAAANGLEGKTSFIKSDVLVYARELGEGGERSFDIIIADPPKLAPTRRDLPRALHKYLKINRAAFRMVKSGGLVLTHTCSAALTQEPEEFRKMVNQAVSLGRKNIGEEKLYLEFAELKIRFHHISLPIYCFPSSTNLSTQANDVGRSITILQTSHAAPCHVQSAVYGESNYLTAMLVAVF